MHCEEVREQLPLLVYDELTGEQADAVRAHAEACEACGDHLQQLQQAQAQLDQWSDVDANEPVGAVLSEAERDEAQPLVFVDRAASSRRGRFMPWAVGAAAGLGLAFVVLALGATVRSGDGGVVISFGRSIEQANHTTEAEPARLSDEQVAELRTMFAQHSQRQTSFALDLVDERFRELEGAQNDRFLALVHTIRAMREEDMQRIEDALTAVAMNSQEQTRQTRQALEDVARTMAMLPPVDLNYEQNSKEIIP